MSPFQLAKHHGTTSCHRKYLSLPLVIGNTSCYRDYLLLSKTPLVIETTSRYRKHLLLSRLPLVIGSTSCYRDYLLLSKLPLVIQTNSCYRKHLLLSRLSLVIQTNSCYRKHLLLSRLSLVIESTSCYRKAFLSDSERHKRVSPRGYYVTRFPFITWKRGCQYAILPHKWNQQIHPLNWHPRTHTNLKAKPTNPRNHPAWKCGFVGFWISNSQAHVINQETHRTHATHKPTWINYTQKVHRIESCLL